MTKLDNGISTFPILRIQSYSVFDSYDIIDIIRRENKTIPVEIKLDAMRDVRIVSQSHCIKEDAVFSLGMPKFSIKCGTLISRYLSAEVLA